MPEKGKKKEDKSGWEETTFPQTPEARSLVSSYYQSRSAFMGHYEPDMLSGPESLLLFELFQFTSKFIAQEKD